MQKLHPGHGNSFFQKFWGQTLFALNVPYIERPDVLRFNSVFQLGNYILVIFFINFVIKIEKRNKIPYR